MKIYAIILTYSNTTTPKKRKISRNSLYTVINYLYKQGRSTNYIAEKFDLETSLVRHVVRNSETIARENKERLVELNYYREITKMP